MLRGQKIFQLGEAPRCEGTPPQGPSPPSPVRHVLGGVLRVAGGGQDEGSARRAPAPVGGPHLWPGAEGMDGRARCCRYRAAGTPRSSAVVAGRGGAAAGPSRGGGARKWRRRPPLRAHPGAASPQRPLSAPLPSRCPPPARPRLLRDGSGESGPG